jgi:hypothetical protein
MMRKIGKEEDALLGKVHGMCMDHLTEVMNKTKKEIEKLD